MIGWLSGTIKELEGNIALVNVAGVGYVVSCSTSCLKSLEPSHSAELLIYTEVKEDLIRLYGFADKLEKQVFQLLMLVKGIGPKSALDLISKVDARDLLKRIGSGDVTRLSTIKGLGKKTAERIVVELKDKIAAFAIEQSTYLQIEKEISEPAQDALLALQALGFTRRDAEKALSSIAEINSLTDSGVIVREALRYI